MWSPKGKAGKDKLEFGINMYSQVHVIWASRVALVVKNPPANARRCKRRGLHLGQEGPLEKGMATHSSVPACRIPWTEEPDGLQSTESQRVGHVLHM